MHDPMTVAHTIRYPWRQKAHKPWPRRVLRFDEETAWQRMTEAEKSRCSRMWRNGYRTDFVTIWHVDPERDGSDDSCGYCTPHLTREQKDRIKSFAWGEARDPYFLRCGEKEWVGTRHEAECIYRGLILHVAELIGVHMTFDRAARQAAMTIHNSDCCDAAGKLCYVPGYHSNSEHDSREWRQQHFTSIVQGMARWMLREERSWWRHPKWHLHHWKIQIHPLQEFKRWAFSKCCKCGKRFPWGYAPCTNSWHGTGPRWFRGERDVYHHDCHNTANNGVCKSTETEVGVPT